MRDFQKQWPDETSNSSNKILGILHYTSKRLASFGLRGPGLIIERWRLRMGLISSGFGSVLMISMGDSSSNRANLSLQTDR
jgi:hypothetical protein